LSYFLKSAIDGSSYRELIVNEKNGGPDGSFWLRGIKSEELWCGGGEKRSRLIAEVVTLEELDEREGEHANGEVEAVSRELSTGKMIEAVLMLEFTDHFLEEPAPFVKVDDGLSVFFFLRNVGGNDPVVVLAVEEITLVVTMGSFDNKTKGVRAIPQGVDSLSELVVGPCAILVLPLFPGVFGDVVDGLHHSRVVASSDGESSSVVKAIAQNKLVEAYRVDADSSKGPRGVLETLMDEGDELFLWHSVTVLEARADKET
jgi:hypothetical protein